MSGLIPVVPAATGAANQSGPSNVEVYGPQLPHATVHQVPLAKPMAPMTKMPVSELTEVAVRLGLNVTFDCISESGPSHHRTFVMKCTVGCVEAQGIANSKKTAKHDAAKLALQKLQESPSYHTFMARKLDTKSAANSNFVGRLQEMTMKRGWGEPEYETSVCDGPVHQRQFETKVILGDRHFLGKAGNKKESKRKAAEAMLASLEETGFTEPPRKKLATSGVKPAEMKPITFVPAGGLHSVEEQRRSFYRS